MNKNKYIILFTVISSIVLFVWLTFNKNNYINEANDHIDMNGLKLLMIENDVKSILDKKFLSMGGFGCKPYINKNDGIEIVFSGFPDVLDNYKLTSIITTNESYHFYDINIGGTTENAISILTKNGFKSISAENRKDNINFKKGKLNVSLTSDIQSKIIKITLNLESTNKKKVVF